MTKGQKAVYCIELAALYIGYGTLSVSNHDSFNVQTYRGVGSYIILISFEIIISFELSYSC